ncbi:3-oxosteroid 1-dehydrogenase [Pararobbsia alpina]|uniref:FAD-dependent oxidoreductase n=1 Tax=Pararobbsia alpina TaxID=621374 RepID=UPI0039A65D56
MENEYDVIVVGSGAAGLSAALTCKIAGLSVVVLEKTEYFGGSTAVSGGAVWIPENPLMASVGHTDSRERAITYLRQTVGSALRPEMMDAYLSYGPAMVRFFDAHTSLKFIPRAVSPDYKPELEGASTGGRTIDPAPFDGRELGEAFNLLRPPLPSFLALGGMMVNRKDIDALLNLHRSWSNFSHATSLVARYLRDRLKWRRGTRLLLGNALAARLLKSALDKRIDMHRNIEIAELITEAGLNAGRVSGVRIRQGAQDRVIKARRAVVLATGGFPQNSALRAALIPHAAVHRSMSPSGNTGDGMTLARQIGGRLEQGNAGAAFWAPVSILRGADGKETVFPHLITDRQKPGLIAVNSAGQRFANEASSYHDFVDSMHREHEKTPCIPAWLICDSTFLKRYGLGLVRPRTGNVQRFIDSKYLYRGDSIEALAGAIGVPAAALKQSVIKINRAAADGHDAEFRRGESAYDRYLGDASHTPNPCIGAIETGPFYAVQVWPGDIGSATGLRVDSHARVLDAQDCPIEGLFACGNDMNSVMGGTYPAAGITLGPALTFGYIAGRTIADPTIVRAKSVELEAQA